MAAFSEFNDLCTQRTSMRYFASQPVDMKDIEELLAAARMAPSVQNTQPWHFHIITNPDLLTKMVECSCYGDFVAGAGAFIVVTADKGAKPGDGGEILWNPKEIEYSCVAAMDHIILGATAKGLGSCWVSLHHGRVHDLLKLPDHHIVIGGIMLGMPSPQEAEHATPHERKPLQDMFSIHA